MRYMTTMCIFDATHLERGMAIQVTTTNDSFSNDNRAGYNALIRAVTPLKLIVCKIRDNGVNEEVIITPEEVAHRKVVIELLTPCGRPSYDGEGVDSRDEKTLKQEIADLRAKLDVANNQIIELQSYERTVTADKAWIEIMDFCKKWNIAPAKANELFVLVTTIRKLELELNALQR